MKRPDSTETALDALRESTDIAPFLRHKSARVVMKAAEKAIRLQAPVAAELVQAFRRMLPPDPKGDPGCAAKLAIVRALILLEDPAAEVFWAGARCVQRDPVWGGTIDVAAQLRGVCAMGLVQMGHPEALLEAVRLLSDKESAARAGAARALGDSGKAEAELVLRLKARGDDDAEVMTECFSALLRLGPQERALGYVGEFLETRKTETGEAAALALGESRLPGAWPLLRDAFLRGGNLPIQRAVLLGLALLRNDAAVDFLVERVAKDREAMAAASVEALAAFRHDAALRTRVGEAVSGRNVTALTEAFTVYWGTA